MSPVMSVINISFEGLGYKFQELSLCRDSFFMDKGFFELVRSAGPSLSHEGQSRVPLLQCCNNEAPLFPDSLNAISILLHFCNTLFTPPEDT